MTRRVIGPAMGAAYMSRDNSNDDLVPVSYIDQIGATQKAIKFLFKDGDQQREEWIPRSQIDDDDTISRVISIPRWLAEEKGLV